jgi:hypothetical protein
MIGRGLALTTAEDCHEIAIKIASLRLHDGQNCPISSCLASIDASSATASPNSVFPANRRYICTSFSGNALRQLFTATRTPLHSVGTCHFSGVSISRSNIIGLLFHRRLPMTRLALAGDIEYSSHAKSCILHSHCPTAVSTLVTYSTTNLPKSKNEQHWRFAAGHPRNY